MDVTLVLTHDCNLGCGYCYAGAKFRKVMPRDIAERAIDLAFSDGAPQVQISFFGGEPLIEWERLVEYAELAKERAANANTKLVMSVTTNGTLLTRERALALDELGVYVALSIDGTKEVHDEARPKMGGGSSFEQVQAGLDTLIARGTPFETISVVTPKSARKLGETVRYLLDRGVPRVGLNPCYEAYFGEDDLEAYGVGLSDAADAMVAAFRNKRIVSITVFDNKILAALKGGLAPQDKCSLGATSVAVAPSGNIYPCERLVAEDEDTSYMMGHVTTGLRVQGEACERGPTNDECGDCGESFRCGSFCACANRAETGKTDVAGGTQCWHERTTAAIADKIASALWEEQNPHFLAWFYGRMAAPQVLAEEAKAKETRRKDAPIRAIPRESKAARKRLTVLT